jgi:hypothetical protein
MNRPSEANSFSATQEIPSPFWNTKRRHTWNVHAWVHRLSVFCVLPYKSNLHIRRHPTAYSHLSLRLRTEFSLILRSDLRINFLPSLCILQIPPFSRPWFGHPKNSGEEYKLWSSSLFNIFQLPITSSICCPKTPNEKIKQISS